MGQQEPWGSRRCCAEQRRTHLPSTFFGSTYAKQEVIFRIKPVGDPTMSMFSPLLPQEVCCFGVLYAIRTKQRWAGILSSSETPHGHLKPQDQTAASNVGSIWRDCRAHRDFQLPLKLTPTLWSWFLCFSEWGNPTAPFTSPGILLLLGLLNPSASPENKVSERGRFCSQEIAQIQGNPELVERSKTSEIEVPSPVLLVLSSKSKVMSHHARQAPAFVLELKGEQSAFICAAAG